MKDVVFWDMSPCGFVLQEPRGVIFKKTTSFIVTAVKPLRKTEVFDSTKHRETFDMHVVGMNEITGKCFTPRASCDRKSKKFAFSFLQSRYTAWTQPEYSS
jgi:hypothetical protein